MGWFRPSLAPVSMSSGVPTPSWSAKHASQSIGMRMRFTRKPGRVPAEGRRLAHLLGERLRDLVGLVARLNGADDLDELHERRRVHEMHADHAIGARRRGGELGQGDARRVAREPLARRQRRVAAAQERELELEVLCRRLDDEVAAGEVLGARAGPDAREQPVARLAVILPFSTCLARMAPIFPLPLVGQLERRVDEDDSGPPRRRPARCRRPSAPRRGRRSSRSNRLVPSMTPSPRRYALEARRALPRGNATLFFSVAAGVDRSCRHAVGATVASTRIRPKRSFQCLPQESQKVSTCGSHPRAGASINQREPPLASENRREEMTTVRGARVRSGEW